VKAFITDTVTQRQITNDHGRVNLLSDEQEGMIQLAAAAKCPFLDILLQQITESYLLVLLMHR